MKWGTAFLTLFISAFAQADSNSPLIIALNEPGQLLEQRQAAVERVKKLLEQKRAGIKPTAEPPVVTRKTSPVAKPAKKKAATVKKTSITKVVEAPAVKTKPVFEKKKIAVVVWGGSLIDDHHFERVMSDQRMAQHMARTVSGSLDKALGTSNDYTNIISRDKANSIVFENDSNGESKNACAQYRVDKVVVVAFSRSSINGQADVVLFDCKNALKKAKFFDLDTTVNERYYLEKDLNKALEKLYKNNIGLLS